MCGICGVFYFGDGRIDQVRFDQMLFAMIHRGPDDQGVYGEYGFRMGMRRLSIIDLETGHQPITNEDSRYVVVLNGEIYNYIELREDLIRRGHKFSTKSDTEVIVHLFEEKKERCVDDLNGMFVFAVWDTKERSLWIFRDPLGIKPLFYSFDEKRIVFSSDLKSLTRYTKQCEIDKNAFLSYLALHFVPYPSSIFLGVQKLSPAHYLKITSQGCVNVKEYWSLQNRKTGEVVSYDACRVKMEAAIRKSILRQLRSDVPIATFLSGGLDSSTVVAFLSQCGIKEMKTFSLAFEGGFDERQTAKMVSDKFQTCHLEKELRAEEVPGILKQLIVYMDEPIADNSIVPTFVLSQIARESGVKVILNGSGGDEIFGGYHRYEHVWCKMRLFMIPKILRSMIAQLVSFFQKDKALKISNPETMFLGSGSDFSLLRKLLKKEYYNDLKSLTSQLFSRHVGHVRTVKDLMFFDLKTYLVDDVLSLLDKMTMAHSLEGRVPLLDRDIVEYSRQIPAGFLFKGNRLKGLMKDIMRDHLPASIFSQPKRGFSGPTAFWVNGSLREIIYRELFEDPSDILKEFMDIELLRKEFQQDKMSSSVCETIFSIYIFSLWQKNLKESHYGQ